MKLFTDFVLVSGIVINAFLLFKVIRKSKHSIPYTLLSALFATSFVLLVNFYAHLHHLTGLYLVSFVFEDGSRFLISVLLFLYVKSLFHKNQYSFFRRYWIHFLPYVLYLIIISVPLALTMANLGFGFKYLSFLQGTQNFTLIKDVFFIGYLIKALLEFNRFKSKMENSYSTMLNRDFVWIGQMLMGSLFVIIVDLSFSLYQFWSVRFSFESGYISALCVVFLLGYLMYFGTNQSSIFLPDFMVDYANPIGQKTEPTPDYLTPTERVSFTQKLEKVMEENQPYLNEDLTLTQLAGEVGLSSKKLSLLLNHHLMTSFYDFINHYRIEEVKGKMKNEKYEKYSLLGLAHLSGFKSKSSFYRSFKKNMGTLPKNYRKNLKKSSSARTETSRST
ncbi:MAG: helix-turn-helix domain-containing protein [Bacteroidota bacterium]